MNKPNTAMIMAAGFGTRMGQLTRDCPKPMLPLNSRPMIDHPLDHIHNAGLTRTVINLHYLGHQITDYLADRTQPKVLFSHEQPQILDTGGGIVQALPLLGPKPFVVMNSDAIFIGPNPVEILLQEWQHRDVDALMLLVPTANTIAYTRAGDFFLNPANVPERRGASDSAPFVYAGAQIIRPQAFTDPPKGPFSTNLIWNSLLEQNRLQAVPYPGQWVDVGTPEGLKLAETNLQAAHA